MNKPNQRIPGGWILTACLLLLLLGLIAWFAYVGQHEQKLIRELDVAEADCRTVQLLVDWEWIRPLNERLKAVITDMPDEAVPLIRNHRGVEELFLYVGSPLDLKDLGTLPRLQRLLISAPVTGCENIAEQFSQIRELYLPLNDDLARALADQPEAWRDQVEGLNLGTDHTSLTTNGQMILRQAFPHAVPADLPTTKH